MSSEICTPPRSSAKATFMDQMARTTLEKMLAQLQGGSITLRDAGAELTYGTIKPGDQSLRVEVLHPRFYRRIVAGGSLGAAEAYLDGDWSCDDLTAVIRILIRNQSVARDMDRGLAKLTRLGARALHWMRRNSRSGSRRNIEAHYDLGNDFFRLFLDRTLLYSSAIFENSDSTLEEASIAKMERICQRLDLRTSDHLLEIGTGWGGFAIHAARNYGCRITTTTISREQFELARQRISEAGLDHRVEVIQRDYRDLDGQYDKLVSIEMIEAVGHQYFDTFFRKCGTLLKPDGLMLLQGIVANEQGYAEYLRSTDFIQRYIFPGGCLPSVLAMGQSIARTTDMRILHVEDFAPHYAQTLRCWRERFWGAIDRVRELGFTERFIRMWHYYFCYCEAVFDERSVGVVQMLLARLGNRRDLQSHHTPAACKRSSSPAPMGSTP